MPGQKPINNSQKNYSDTLHNNLQGYDSSTQSSITIQPQKTSRKNLIYLCLIAGLALIGLIIYFNNRNNDEKRVNLAVEMYCVMNEARAALGINSKSGNMTINELQAKSMALPKILAPKMQSLMQKYNLNQSELEKESKKIDELMIKDKSFYQKVYGLTAAKGCLPFSQ